MDLCGSALWRLPFRTYAGVRAPPGRGRSLPDRVLGVLLLTVYIRCPWCRAGACPVRQPLDAGRTSGAGKRRPPWRSEQDAEVARRPQSAELAKRRPPVRAPVLSRATVSTARAFTSSAARRGRCGRAYSGRGGAVAARLNSATVVQGQRNAPLGNVGSVGGMRRSSRVTRSPDAFAACVRLRHDTLTPRPQLAQWYARRAASAAKAAPAGSAELKERWPPQGVWPRPPGTEPDAGELVGCDEWEGPSRCRGPPRRSR